MPELEFTKIATYATETEAGQFQSILEENGIPAFIEGATANTMLSYIGSALGGVKLMVRSTDATRASELVGADADSNKEVTESWYCGDCKEQIEPGFEVCWSCGKAREEAEQSPPEATTQDELVSDA